MTRDANTNWKPYFDGLRSDTCRCGHSKEGGKSLCWQCWTRLPKSMQKSLYRRIGSGYEEAYDEAIKYLGEKK